MHPSGTARTPKTDVSGQRKFSPTCQSPRASPSATTARTCSVRRIGSTAVDPSLRIDTVFDVEPICL